MSPEKYLKSWNFQLSKVDFEESAAQGRFVVKVGVDPELDQSKFWSLAFCEYYH